MNLAKIPLCGFFSYEEKKTLQGAERQPAGQVGQLPGAPAPGMDFFVNLGLKDRKFYQKAGAKATI